MRVVSHEQAVEAASAMFNERSDVDMDVLGRQLAISRATLYRIVGSRDRLLGDVFWRQGSTRLSRVLASVHTTGVERIMDVAARFDDGLVRFGPLRRFIEEDPPTAFRVLFGPEANVHGRFVELWAGIFTAETASGAWVPPLPVEDLSYLFVRLSESMLYADLLVGREPNLALAAHVQRLTLTSPGP